MKLDNSLNMSLNIEDFNDAYNKDDLFHEYLNFSRFFQNAFIKPGGYLIDTGNFQTVNRALLDRVYEKIKKHPIIWNLFFKI